MYLLFALFARNFINISGTQNFRSPLSCIFIYFKILSPGLTSFYMFRFSEYKHDRCFLFSILIICQRPNSSSLCSQSQSSEGIIVIHISSECSCAEPASRPRSLSGLHNITRGLYPRSLSLSRPPPSHGAVVAACLARPE